MGQGQFENQKALIEYAEAHDLAYGEGSPAFAKRWRLAQLAQPRRYELVEVPTKRGCWALYPQHPIKQTPPARD